MCRAGGRRCPGQYDPAKAAARNARRRAQRAAAKAHQGAQGSSVGGGESESMGTTPGSSNTSGEASTERRRNGEVAIADSGSRAAPVRDERGSIQAVPVEESTTFSPLTDLNLTNDGFMGSAIPAIYAMENTAISLEADGEHEVANTLRFLGREMATISSYSRASITASRYHFMAVKAEVDEKPRLRDAYFAAQGLLNRAAMRGVVKDEVVDRGLSNIEKRFSSGELQDTSGRYDVAAADYLRRRELRASETEPDKRFSVEERSYTAKEIMEGRSVSGEKISPEVYGELHGELSRHVQERADLLTSIECEGGNPPYPNTALEDGEYARRDKRRPLRAGDKVPGAPGFTWLGNGAEHNVYLDGESGLVYKIPHALSPMLNDRRLNRAEVNRMVEEAYASVNDAALRERGVENVATAFVSSSSKGQKHYLLVQPAYSQGEWTGVQLSASAEDELEQYGVNDLHDENVMINMETGEIRLLDCLGVDRWGDSEDDYYDDDGYGY